MSPDLSKEPRAAVAAPPRRVRRARLSLLRRFGKNRDGATAVEFAFVAIPFFALMFAIIETGLVFWTSQVLETAVADASRGIYTGQFQGTNPVVDGDAAPSAEAFKAAVCSRVVALFDCETSLLVDVRAFDDFGDVVLPPVLDADGNIDPGAFVYQQSSQRQVVTVRAALAYPVFVTLMDASRANLADGRRLILATATFRNEPFGGAGGV